tara:strand:- start:2309 stop:2503 length:195 start_codon:yes stop_codon:yes gene_type:complete
MWPFLTPFVRTGPYSLIVTAKMNDIDGQAWLADVLARMPNMPVSMLPKLLPWNWRQPQKLRQAA